MPGPAAPKNLLRTLSAAALAAALALAGCVPSPPPEAPEDTGAEAAGAEPAPEAGGTLILDATVAAQNGQYATARTMLEGLLETQPDDIEALRLLARVYSAEGDAASSRRTWEKVGMLDPYDPDAAYESGVSLAREEKWSDLYSKMSALEGAGGADKRHYLLLGEAGLELGYYSKAEDYLEKAGGAELATVLLGKLYYRKGRTAEAEEAFRKALDKNGDNYTANLHMGYISFNKGRKAAALKYYSRAHRADPSAPLPCLSMASVYEKTGRLDAAAEWYEKALGLDRTARAERRKVYISLTRILLESRKPAEAARIAARGAGEFPDAGGIYYYWGEALLRTGDKEGARERFKKAAEDQAWRKHALERFHSIR